MADIDQESRNKIRHSLDKNYFVEAGAGSGKTSVLVDRMVSMVESGIDISKICAITFTKAAAGEFYARFQRKLSESGNENAKRALRDIDLCFMGTIDSFCNMIISEHPAEAGVPSDAQVITDDDLDILIRQEYSLIQQGKRGQALLDKCNDYKKFVTWNGEEFFISGVKTLMDMRNAHFNLSTVDPVVGKTELLSKGEVLRSILTCLHEHPEYLYVKGDAKNMEAQETLMQEWSTISGDWDRKLSDIVSIMKSMRNIRILPDIPDTVYAGGDALINYFEDHESRKKIAWRELSKESVFHKFLNAYDDLRFSISAEFFQEAVKDLAKELKAKGQLSFFDYLLYLRDMLKEDTKKGGKLIRHIYDRHSYFLIDEFQDTNPLQAEIFFYLTAKEPKEDWKTCIPREGSLFIVGDPKQSIYRFRSADVGSYLRVKDLFAGEVGEVLSLTRNFRSTDVLCQWFNEVCPVLLDDPSGQQGEFREIPLGEKPEYKASLNGVYYYRSQTAQKIEDRNDVDEVAQIIANLVSDETVTVQGRGESAQPRNLQYKDIMLITYSKSRLEYFMKTLSDYGIPYTVEGKVIFSECQPLKALSKIMNAVADPSDRKAVYASSRLTKNRVNKKTAEEYHHRTQGMSPEAVFSLLLNEQMIFLKEGTDKAEYVYYALELLREAQTNGTITSLKEGARFIEELVTKEVELERSVQLSRDLNRVHIANLHKVKGLEAPVVILADPYHKDKEPGSRMDHSTDPCECYLFEISDDNRNSMKSNDFAEMKEKERRELDLEKMRLLYVAATRAENALIIAKKVNSKGEEVDADDPWFDFMPYVNEDIFDVIGRTAGKEPKTYITDAEELYQKAKDSSVLSDRASEAKSYSVVRPSMIKVKAVVTSDESYDDETEALTKGTSEYNAALMGTVIHRLMEVLVSSGNEADLAAAADEIVKEYEASAPVYKEAILSVGEAMRKGGFDQETDVPKDLLSELSSADEAYCEVPFAYIKETAEGPDEVWNGVMDLIYKKDGQWHIIDYKTNAESDELDTKYEGQLNAYIDAFRKLTGEEADARIYHIDK